MKYRIRLYGLGLLTALLVAACVGKEELVFEDTPAARINEAVERYEKVLLSAENGWLGYYYPEKNYKIGGYAMHFKFAGKEVTISSEAQTNEAPGVEATSEWRMEKSQGPVLSINTYNPVLNYYSEVTSASDTDGMCGDYEFVVVSVSSDEQEMTLQGKKYGNRMILKKCAANFDAKAYFDKVNEFQNLLIEYPTFEMVIDGKKVAFAAFVGRTLQIEWEKKYFGSSTNVAFGYTENGISFAQPLLMSADSVAVANSSAECTKLTGLTWVTAKSEYESSDPNVNLSMQPKYSDNYQMPYKEMLGEWTMEYDATSAGAVGPSSNRKTTTVVFRAKERGASYYMSAPDALDFDSLTVNFDPLKGVLIFRTQYIPNFVFKYPGTSSAHQGKDCQIRLYMSGTKSTSIYADTSEAGVKSTLTTEDGKQVLSFDNYISTRDYTGFYLRVCDLKGASLSTNYTINKGGHIFAYIKLYRNKP